MLTSLLILLASTIAIALGSNWIVESAARVAKRFQISELVIGLTVVAFGTSAPEFAVSLLAAFQKQGNISVGNIVGSNIFNLGIILGGCALFVPIQTSPTLLKRDGTFLLVGTLLLFAFLILLQPYTLARWEGGVLFTMLLTYLIYLYLTRSKIDLEELPANPATWLDALLLPLGLTLVIVGAHFLVQEAVKIAYALGVSTWIISVTIVAAGTSIPEVATSLTAAIKGRHGISAGNLIGSDIFNMYGVLGLSALVNPLHVKPASYGSLIALVAMVGLTLVFVRTGWKISRKEGLALVLLALARWAYNFRGQLGLTAYF